jgi:BMFP domain-containing protein YqiC
LKPTPRIVTDYLSELNIRCDFHPRGCLEIVKLNNLERHVASCGFSPVQCSNDGCNALVSLRDKFYHQSEVCEFRKSKCHDCSQLKKEIKEMRDQMVAEHNQIKDEIKGMKEQVKKEVKNEIKELTVQMLSRLDQQEMQSEIFAHQDQMIKEIKQHMKGIQLTKYFSRLGPLLETSNILNVFNLLITIAYSIL